MYLAMVFELLGEMMGTFNTHKTTGMIPQLKAILIREWTKLVWTPAVGLYLYVHVTSNVELRNYVPLFGVTQSNVELRNYVPLFGVTHSTYVST